MPDASSVRRDPAVRKDGRCARKGCDKKLPRSKRAMKYAGRVQLEADPWCSSTCCRAFHGCPLDNGRFTEEQIEARSDYGRRGKQAGPLSRGEMVAA